VIVGSLLTLLVLSARPAGAGDRDLAQFLLKHGRESLDKGDAADALSKLEKARIEDPGLIEATYWVALANEKGGNLARAIVEYRTYVDLAAAKEAGAGLSRDEGSLLKKARSRLDTLDAGTREIERSNDAFAAKVLALAKPLVEKDPALAERALRVLVGVCPGHAEALRLLAQAAPAEAEGEGVLAGLPDRWDLLKSHAFGKNDGWVYGDDTLDVTAPKGEMVMTPGGYDSGPIYAMEARLDFGGALNPGKSAVVGLAFGVSGGEAIALLLPAGQVTLERAAKGGFVRLGGKATTPWQSGVPRTLAVRVEGLTVRAYLDGELVVEHVVEKRADLAGDIGLFHENCKVRYTRIMFARPGKGGAK
jgi:hypothetical protein